LFSITEVHIRFRYNKSKEKFTIQKFCSTFHRYMDPIDECVSIFRCTQYLQVHLDEPLGVYRSESTSYSFLTDTIVKQIMRQACCLAYPDPPHELCIKITSIVADFNCITAAVCLQQGGATIDEIASCLHWQPGSIPTYLRECSQGVGNILKKAILGVYRSA
jgi:hypothetical protein